MDSKATITKKKTSRVYTAFLHLFEELTGREPTADEIHSDWYQKTVRILAIIFLPMMAEKGK